MDLYDPNHPSINHPYYFLELSDNIRDHLKNNLEKEDLMIFYNNNYIGIISKLCGRIFCQSKISNGIVGVCSSQTQLGHLVVIQNKASEFVNHHSNSFLIDSSFQRV